MCGIAGYSLRRQSRLDPLTAGRVLIAAIAERGADAAGCAYARDGRIVVEKQPGGASAFLEQFSVDADVRQLLLHVRDHTKGRPSLLANNHPIRHGSIVGVHNGKITNDEEIFEELGCGRAEPGMTVDSEAIFALLENSADHAGALERLRGSLAVGWFDEARADEVHIARGYGRPLWTGQLVDGTGLLWASTLEALEIAEEFLGVRLYKRPVAAGTILTIADGDIMRRERFAPDHSAEWLVNPVASPHERVTCLARLEDRIA